MTLHINQQIDKELLEVLVNAYNKLEYTSCNEKEHLIIYFSSPGGENSSTSALIHLINTYKDITTLFAYNEISSNGFRLFYEVECYKEIIDDTFGMYHLSSHPGVHVYEGGTMKNNEYSHFVNNTLNNYNYLDNVNSLVKFTKEELKNIKDNRDVYFSTERLREMLKFNTL